VARITGVELASNKKVNIGLTAIFGIGRPLAEEILSKAKVDSGMRVRDLTESQVNELRKIIESGYKIEGNLKREISSNINRLINIGCYRGIRHKKGLPVRGQRTRSNARTRKGRRRTVGSKKKAAK
jgi:small subunit ribosomal protein S13